MLALVAGAAFANLRNRSGAPLSSSTGSATGSASRTASGSPTQGPSATGSATLGVADVYSGMLLPTLPPQVAGTRSRVYVPNNGDNSVTVIDPLTFKVLYTFPVGRDPQHVSPSWDMKHLYVGNVYSNTLTEIDPRTGKPVRTISVPDPYNLYFTPDGKHAIDVAERLDMVLFYDPKTWELQGTVRIPWSGPDHLDFSADGSYFIISTEYAGRLVKIDVASRTIVGSVELGGSTVDVKISPDGKVFYVANQSRGGVSVVDPLAMKEIAFIPTGRGAHGFAVSRNTKDLYVSNRLGGSVSVISFATREVIDTWHVGASPDMMQVSVDGTQLWASNRYDASVSVIDTRTGRLLHTIAVGRAPHGLTLFPQPGHYSIGHNGVYR